MMGYVEVERRIPVRLAWVAAVLALMGPAHAGPAAPDPEMLPLCGPRPAGPLVAGTTAEDVEQLVRDFVRAYNAGDAAALDEIFAPEPDFEWYTVDGERMYGAAENRATLVPYFERRHRLGDRIRLLAIRVDGERAWHGGYDFGFELRRVSGDASARGRYHGKGAAGCTVYTWSMGLER